MLVYQRVIVVSAIEIWYKHLDKMTLQVIYQQDLSLMILRVSIKLYIYSRLFFHFEWVVCWLNRRRSCFPLSLTGEISINLHIYIISYLFVKSWSLLFFLGGTPPFFLNWWSSPGQASDASAWRPRRWWSWSKLRLGGRCGLPQELDGLGRSH